MTAKELRTKFDIDLKQLQDNCPHKKTELLEYHYAPGHFGGMILLCTNCEKRLDAHQ